VSIALEEMQRSYKVHGVDLSNLSRWIETIYQQPAAKRGIEIPQRHNAKKIFESGQSMIAK